MIKGSCITAKVMTDHYTILLCCQSLQEHLEAASSCFANTCTENINEQVLIQKFTYKNIPGDKTHVNAIKIYSQVDLHTGVYLHTA